MTYKAATTILAIILAVAFNEASGQSITVTGKVLYNPTLNDCFQQVPCLGDVALTNDKDWIPPKAAVNIVSKNTGNVAKTDREGNYSIETSSANDTLMFLYIGHNRIEVPVNGRSRVDVKLTPTPIPVIERLLAQIMPAVDAGMFPDISEIAENAQVNHATARDILWLVLGNTRMKQHYPTEYIPDYRFSESD